MSVKLRAYGSIGIFTVIAIFFLIRFFIIGYLELSPDEAYYWYWSQHLDLSYADHPPMVAYIMALFTWIGGDTELFVRLGGFVCSAIALVLLYQTSVTLFPALLVRGPQGSGSNTLLAWELLFIFNITLLFPAGCIIQTPDVPMIFFWTAAVFFGSRIITGGTSRWWYLLGAAVGLGLLSKYTMILFIPAMFLFLLLSPSHRYWFRRKEPYLALLIALIIFSPVIYWNWQHQWVSFAYQLNHGFEPKRREFLDIILKLLEYLGGQAAVITPLLFIAFVMYSIKGIAIYLRRGIPAYLYLLLLSWPILLFFGLTTALGKVAEANWPAAAYIAGFILMCHVFNEQFRTRKGHRKFFQIGVGFALFLNIVIHIHLVYPFLPIPPNIDPVSQFHGWKDLGGKINAYIDENPRKDGYFLLADKGTAVAEAVFYTGNRFIGIDFVQPERYIFLKNGEALRGKDAVILLHGNSKYSLDPYRSYFEDFKKNGTHTSTYNGEKIDYLTFQMIEGKRYRGNWKPYSGVLQ